jgi:hypothetical protein
MMLTSGYCEDKIEDLPFVDDFDAIVSPEATAVMMIRSLQKGSNHIYEAYKPIFKALLDRRLEVLQDKIKRNELDENTYIEACKKSRIEYELIFNVYPRLFAR